MTSPRCLANSLSTSSAVSAVAGSTVTLQLDDRSGVDVWDIVCISTDDLNTSAAINATLVITDTVNRIATFTNTAAGGSCIFSSTVNRGVDVNGRSRSDWTTTFKVFAPTAGNLQVLATGETGEAGPFGWVSPINAIIRATAGSGGNGADPGAAYILVGTTSSLGNERSLTAGNGLKSTDAGANSTFTLSINDNITAGISGSTFTKLSGSLQKTSAGLSYLVAGANVTVTTGSNGQIVIASTAAGGTGLTYVTGSWFENALNQFVTTGSISVDTGKRSASTIGTDVFFFVSGSSNLAKGSNHKVAVFGGDVILSGGLTGSLQLTAAGLSYLVAGSNTTITSASNGQITIASTGGGGLTSVTGTFRDPGNSFVTTGSLSIDAGNRAVSSLGTDIFVFISGSSGVLSGSNKKVTVVNDIVYSGSAQVWQIGSGTRDWRIYGQTSTTNATAKQVFQWPLASGSTSVDIKADACSANVGQAASIRLTTLYRNQAGSIFQDQIVGGYDTGRFVTSGTLFNAQLDKSSGIARLYVTGSASTYVSWTWDLLVREIKP